LTSRLPPAASKGRISPYLEGWQLSTSPSRCFDGTEWFNVRELADLNRSNGWKYTRTNVPGRIKIPRRPNPYFTVQIYLNTVGPISYYIHVVSYSYSVVFIFSQRLWGRIIFIYIWIYSKNIFPYHIFGQHYQAVRKNFK
jgi:hypothetical protein